MASQQDAHLHAATRLLVQGGLLGADLLGLASGLGAARVRREGKACLEMK